MGGWLYDYLIHDRIDRNKEIARRADHGARVRDRKLGDRIGDLEDTMGEMALFLRTLTRLLFEKGTISRSEFLEVARAIDAQDGEVDGQYRGKLDAP